MRNQALISALLGILLGLVSAAGAEDVREAARQAEADRRAALEQARKVEERIMQDRQTLLAEVERLEAREDSLEKALTRLDSKMTAGEKRRVRLEDRWAERELDFKEVSGNVRVVARELESFLEQSPLTAVKPERLGKIKPLLDKGYFPDIDDISQLAWVFFDEIKRSGQVGLIQTNFVGRDGEDQIGDVLTLGRFTAAYRDEDEVGFLSYSPESHRFFALSSLPNRSVRSQLSKYMEGKTPDVPFDMSGGASMRQITHKTSFMEQIRAGGPIVWPIGALAVAALVIVVGKIRFLNQVRRNTGKYMTRVNTLAAQGKWEECHDIVRRHKGEHSPVNHVIEAGLESRKEDRETLESVLQESILRELPRLERGLSPLAIFGAVAPLLGLLGTVTGMIDTFRVITLYGTGDPKLMSGGISEALVTTELGLAVAIPIMLLHTFLSRRVERIVGEMEEKAVSLTNIIEKSKRSGGQSAEDKPCELAGRVGEEEKVH
jgi:biopolymer transport protein ExbB